MTPTLLLRLFPMRLQSTVVQILLVCCRVVVVFLSSFLKIFKATLHTMSQYNNLSSNSSLRITLLMQKYSFMSVKLFFIDSVKLIMCFCKKLPVIKCLKIQFKIGLCLSVYVQTQHWFSPHVKCLFALRA